ncbi:hypothetical protein D3C76_1621190 [compost metagenome]
MQQRYELRGIELGLLRVRINVGLIVIHRHFLHQHVRRVFRHCKGLIFPLRQRLRHFGKILPGPGFLPDVRPFQRFAVADERPQGIAARYRI